MAKYISKQVVIDAVFYKGYGSLGEKCPLWAHEAYNEGTIQTDTKDPENMIIKTLEGDMVCRPGSYIIRGTQGELYPCKPDVFNEKYEEVETNENE